MGGRGGIGVPMQGNCGPLPKQVGQDRKNWPLGEWPGSYHWRNEGKTEKRKPTAEEKAAREERARRNVLRWLNEG
jgi:hypothetical protein